MKTRRHHNNKGLRQIKNGKTQKDADYYRKKYLPKEDKDRTKFIDWTQDDDDVLTETGL